MDRPTRLTLEFPRSGQQLFVYVPLQVTLNEKSSHSDARSRITVPPYMNVVAYTPHDSAAHTP